MAVSGLKKAAMLLMSVDPVTASELLRGLGPDVVTNIAMEIANLDASGYSPANEGPTIVKEFYQSLRTKDSPSGNFEMKSFLSTMLESTVGAKKSQEIQGQINDVMRKRDQFLKIRNADPKKIAAALDGEHPLAIAVVLSELPAKKASQILLMLSEDIRLQVVTRIAGSEMMSRDTKMRIAQGVWGRIQSLNESSEVMPISSSDMYRKIAMMLQGLPRDLREGMLNSIKQSDEAIATAVRKLMITWEDIPTILDRPLQQALRGIDSQQLAKALTKSDERVVTKIRTNISERARTLLDEEIALLSAPKKDEIDKARGELVTVLQEMNEKGELAFIED
ncbi:MAG: hypothetical protein A2Y07_09200 [Planctomycetes bacterium GWF2_50_10]|nr:MAG: hypothetical protein A2Y07_09200 [Planctomycetes bacterium GWF2_50_10]